MYIIPILIALSILIFFLLWGKKDKNIQNTNLKENFKKTKEYYTRNRITNNFSNKNINLLKESNISPKHELDKKSMKTTAKQYPNQRNIFHDSLYDHSFNDPYSKTTYHKHVEGKKNSGLRKCLNTCKGNCVEFGITGSAWCFPPIIENP